MLSMKMNRRRSFQIIMINHWMFLKPCSKDTQRKGASLLRPFFIMLVQFLLHLSRALVINFAFLEGFVIPHFILFGLQVLVRGYAFHENEKLECIVRFSLLDSVFH